MARNNQTTQSGTDPYTVLLNKDGAVIAFINPASHVNVEDLVKALTSKGLAVETRTPQTEDRSVEL